MLQHQSRSFLLFRSSLPLLSLTQNEDSYVSIARTTYEVYGFHNSITTGHFTPISSCFSELAMTAFDTTDIEQHRVAVAATKVCRKTYHDSFVPIWSVAGMHFTACAPGHFTAQSSPWRIPEPYQKGERTQVVGAQTVTVFVC